MTIRELEPKLIWEQFDDITKVPRPSKKEGKIIEWLVAFAEKHGFDYQKDQTGKAEPVCQCHGALCPAVIAHKVSPCVKS